MFKSIIWATDGSTNADAALPFVKELATTFGAKVTVVHADQHFMGRGGGYSAFADEPDLRAEIRDRVEKLKAEGFDASFRLISGTTESAADLIADVARELPAELIVVGSRGHGAIASALIGSVTTRLLHVAPCPVFAVPVRLAARERELAATTA